MPQSPGANCACSSCPCPCWKPKSPNASPSPNRCSRPNPSRNTRQTARLPTRSIPFNWPKANLPISRNKRWKTTLWPCSSPESCPANPWTPSTKAGSGQPRSGARSQNREGTPLPNFWISEQDKTIQSCYPTLQWRIGNPAVLTSYANSGQRRPIRPRAARLATGLQTCGSRLRKNTRDPHLPVMRVTMATTLHSGVYPPPGASRWLNRANPPASIRRAPRSSLPSEKWAVLQHTPSV